MEKISIIVPIYNASNYLTRCLDSIINQTYKNLEIILINDGSTDNSADICHKYANLDKRIIIYNQKNKGISIARNQGLKLASGSIIGFVDSDDVISPTMYETLYKLMKSENTEIACCKYTKFKNKYSFIQNNKYMVYSSTEALKMNLNEEISNFLWDKIFDKKLFKNIKFKNNIIFKDYDIIYKLISKANRVAVSTSILYGYFQRNNSSVHTYSYGKLINYINVYTEKYNYLMQNYPSLKIYIIRERIFNIFILFRNIAISGNRKFLKDKMILKEYKDFKALTKKTKYNYSHVKNFLIKLLRIDRNMFYYVSFIMYKIKEK